ncbi:uncharacterized protein Z518_04093 [Rhinocladiella mackenziei CBS 650.93]|uniref:Rhinocladiella mackenziei CBS 650.93 unplaced genomic scaffold supercont1.3, whole genome shotgun sequence n=1 Tax=Rhinocladiella mackenziei CBS 650.93 TaxID=1442369 RepID=A0A0D2IK95_9EURO|nr:uncharacterized protein Z518_04093 [Rhinocladiella mackenziei CBS 650.93]KIX06119.1 hypothetical protein Z518_04093 [Rhinocladiella mackenziei CBS 650.93]
MQVVWEADTAAFASRKRAARACQKCRAAKKRCHHTFQRPPEQQAESDGLDRILPNLTHKEPIRFVGDLNPESILTDLSSRSKGAQRISRIGTWVEQSRHIQDELPQEDLGPRPKSGDKTPVNVEKYGKLEGGRRTLTGHQRNYLQSVGAFRILPKSTQDALITTYIACLDGLLPIFNGVKLLQDYLDGRCSIFLIQAICLVTCKTEEAAPYLRLYDDGPLLDPIPFARSLHTGLDAAMKADLEPDRVTKIQILTLMHLHNDGPGGIEESSLHLSQAIHDAWTAGLHIHTPGRTPRDQSSLLWWTIWTLDKINACLGGRPIMIANRDIDIARPPLLEDGPRSQVINVWLRLGDLLDQVIEFYRPAADQDATGWETEFPSYSSLTEDVNLTLLRPSEQSILELCYHVVAILSCRAGGPSTASYARRVSAADRIQQIFCDGGHAGVAPIPLVPYAVGLSLTVAYRGFRDNAIIDAERAQADMTTRCEMLEALSMYWWTADAMARLGRKALKSLQQPGARKHSVANIANAMDAEVAVCKFGPFDSKSHSSNHDNSLHVTAVNGPGHGSGPMPGTGHGNGNDVNVSTGNALHVLSDAAATHSSTGISHDPPTLTPSFATSRDRRMMHDENSTAAATATSTGLPPTPHRSFAADSTTTLATSSFEDPQYQYHIDDLDNLFDGFFDLSMPTIFQDPVFDGDAFLNASMDFMPPDGSSGQFDTVADAMNTNSNLGSSMGVGVGLGQGQTDSVTGSGPSSMSISFTPQAPHDHQLP